MDLKVFENEQLLAESSAQMMADFLQKKPDALFCFAAGMTQASTYRVFAEKVKAGKVDVSKMRVVGLDDMVGTRRANKEGFYYFLDDKLFEAAGIRDEQITFFNPAASNLDAECDRINNYLDQNGPIDFLLLGIGMNGHIGYNEPGSPMDGRSHVVTLHSSSVAVGSAYFTHEVKADRGITLGMKDLFSAKNILIQIIGEKKAEIAAKAIAQPISQEVPASLLRNLGNVKWYLDAQAASSLPKE